MAGYNIQCDQGSLYYRKCYVVLPSGEKQEIIGYTSGGDPISKDSTDVPKGTAWVPTMTTLDMSGNAYQPYPEGIPYTAGGGSVVNWTPSGGADISNIDTYLNQSMPGAYARQMEKDRTCNPLWPTFGCKTYTEDSVPIGTTGGSTTETSEEPTPSLWESITSWWSGSAESFKAMTAAKPSQRTRAAIAMARNPEGADFGQPLDSGGDALGSNFGQDQGAQARMAADEEMQVVEQDIPGNYIEPETEMAWNRLAVPAIVLGGLGLALWQDKRMNRGGSDEWY
jgi:hypothetical protein